MTMSTKEELKAWDYGEKGKNAAVYIEKKGELHTAMHDPKSEKVSLGRGWLIDEYCALR